MDEPARRKHSTEELFTLLYDELRRLAAQKISGEAPGQTLQATSLVHEAFLRLGGGSPDGSPDGPPGNKVQGWDSRNHFFCAAAEAMRRILVDNARRRRRQKRGGGQAREALSSLDLAATEVPDRLLDVNEALTKLEAANPQAAAVVKLRYFVGFTNQEAAGILEVSPRKVDQLWAYARAWLLEAIGDRDL